MLLMLLMFMSIYVYDVFDEWSCVRVIVVLMSSYIDGLSLMLEKWRWRTK